MRIKKGPYGQFVVHDIDDNSINPYAIRVIESNRVTNLLSCCIEEKRCNSEVMFDSSGLISLDEYMNKQKSTLNERINAIGHLFESLISCLDVLLPLQNLCLDVRYIFIDKNTEIKLCYIPTITDSQSLLSEIDITSLESLLSHDFFNKSLTEDEKSSIIYAFKTNDEHLLTEVINDIYKSKDEKRVPLDFERLSFLLLTIFTSIIAIFSLLLLDRIYGVILTVISFGLAFKVAYDDKRSKKHSPVSNLKDERTRILFEEDRIENIDDNLFSYACLEHTNPNVQDKKLGLYSKENTIGSDRFIADIYLNDPKVSSLHAKLQHIDKSYWLIDCSERNNTYIENRSIRPNESYEIKNGQLIRFGDTEFIFKVGY